MITPLLDNDTLDVAGLGRLIEHILAGGVHGLFILGTTGEATSLSYPLRHELVERTCSLVAGRVPVLVGITDTAFPESVRLAKTALKSGASAVVAAPPYYYTLGQAELTEYYQHLADQLPLPLFLYNMPAHTKVTLEPATVKVLARHPNVIGLKDSSGNAVYLQLLRHTMQEDPGFSLLVGPEEATAEMVVMGAHGGVNGGANMFPQLYVDLYKAAAARDFERLMPLHNKVLEISSRIYTVGRYSSSYLKGVKCALSLMGICSDFLAEPLHRFREPERKIIQEYLEEMNVEIKTLVAS